MIQSKPRAASRLLTAGVIVLACIGLIAAAGRATSVAISVRSHAAPEMSPYDEAALDVLAFLLRVSQERPVYTDAAEQERLIVRRFNGHPITTLLHVVPAMLFMLLAPLQFSRRIRTRYNRWHRFAGRILVVLAIPLVFSALYFGVVMPFSGFAEAVPILLSGVLFVISIVRAVVAIRKRDITAHGEWMTRMFGIALGAGVQRLIATICVVVTRRGPETWFPLSLWLGFGISAAAAELVVQSKRSAHTLRRWNPSSS